MGATLDAQGPPGDKVPVDLPGRLYEDRDLLAVHKPAGVNTHRPDEQAQEGTFEWARRLRGEPELALLHRLDKETSGVLLLGRTPEGNKALADQFAGRDLSKRYALLVPQDLRRPALQRCDLSVRGKKRRGEVEQEAETDFELLERGERFDLYEARPSTGRTHQVRLHAARLGMPIVGDVRYQGQRAARLFLHAAGVSLRTTDGAARSIEAPLPEAFRRVLGGAAPGDPWVAAVAALEARRLVVDAALTDAFLWLDREHDGLPEVRVERLGDVGLAVRTDEAAGPLPPAWVRALMQVGGLRALVEQRRPRRGGRGPFQVVAGELTEPRFAVQEHGLRYLVDLSAEQTSSGLFLDQRETRGRLLSADLRGKTVLNAFAHTGSLSLAAAHAGAETVTLDLSRRYLAWARENMELNGVDPAGHDFIYGDALEWLARLEKKGRRFDLVLLDPPSFGTGAGRRKRGTWSVERDLGALVGRAARLAAPSGTVLVSTNLHRLTWARFAAQVHEGLTAAGRRAEVEPATLPLDHRTGPGAPAYLKLAWLTLD